MDHRSRGSSSLTVSGLLMACALVGCAQFGEVAEPSPVPPSTEDSDGPEVELDGDPEEANANGRSPNPLVLEEAEIHFAEGRYRTAAALFERYLTEDRHVGGVEGEDDRALWGLAMLHLLPESPLHDREEAMAMLDRLVTEHGESRWGIQARWTRDVLQELDDVRGQAARQEALLRQLTETVEQLRQIDLNRRPTGSGDTTTARGDTIPSF